MEQDIDRSRPAVRQDGGDKAPDSARSRRIAGFNLLEKTDPDAQVPFVGLDRRLRVLATADLDSQMLQPGHHQGPLTYRLDGSNDRLLRRMVRC